MSSIFGRGAARLALVGSAGLYVVVLGFTQAAAQTAVYLDENADRCEIFRSISPVVPEECAFGTRGLPGTRGVVMLDDQPVVAPEPGPYEVAMRVEFAYDSADLTPQARQVLDRVADVLNDPLLSASRFLVEGHADANGAADYNQRLSERRARAVRDYMVGQLGVGVDRLITVGKGEAEPYDPARPNDGINRRVEFLNLSS